MSLHKTIQEFWFALILFNYVTFIFANIVAHQWVSAKSNEDIYWAAARLNCPCMVWYEQQQIQMDKQFKDFHRKFVIDESEYEKGNRRKSYSWLLQMLAPPPIRRSGSHRLLYANKNKSNVRSSSQNKSKEVGLDICVTDTAIFRKGKLRCIVMNNKQGRIFANYNIKNISLHRIRLWFSNAMHKRWKVVNTGTGWFEPFNFEDKLYKNSKQKHENIALNNGTTNGRELILYFIIILSLFTLYNHILESWNMSNGKNNNSINSSPNQSPK